MRWLGGSWPGRNDLDRRDLPDEFEIAEVARDDGGPQLPSGGSQQEVVRETALAKTAGIASECPELAVKLRRELPCAYRGSVDPAPGAKGLNQALNLTPMAATLRANQELVDDNRTQDELG